MLNIIVVLLFVLFMSTGENPSQAKRWEVTATVTTPNPNYAVIGVSSHYVADEKQPSFDLQLNWPGKEFKTNLKLDVSTEGYSRGRFQMNTPFQQLHQFTIDGSFTSPSDLNVCIS